MRRLLVFALLLLMFISSCKKEGQLVLYPSYYGQWQYIGYRFGPGFIAASADSSVILTLIPPNSYLTSLNGYLSTQGTFRLDSSMDLVSLQFNNITQPYGSWTVVGTTSGVTFLYFNYSQIGQLTLFQFNYISAYGDTLEMLQGPVITPDPVYNFFKRI